tara:strand:- start:6932 stop:7483 length:552 start_codon:yes stop_codon:yes gene_type:complete
MSIVEYKVRKMIKKVLNEEEGKYDDATKRSFVVLDKKFKNKNVDFRKRTVSATSKMIKKMAALTSLKEALEEREKEKQSTLNKMINHIKMLEKTSSYYNMISTIENKKLSVEKKEKHKEIILKSWDNFTSVADDFKSEIDSLKKEIQRTEDEIDKLAEEAKNLADQFTKEMFVDKNWKLIKDK